MSYDPHYANVSLLLHGDGADNGTVFTDNSPSPKTVTAYGNAKTSTAQSKFGGSSISLDGSGDYLSLPDVSDFDLGGSFTIELFVRLTSYNTSEGNPTIIGKLSRWAILGPSSGFPWTFRATDSANTTESISGGSLSLGVWHHIAVTYDGTKYRTFTDGALNTEFTFGALNTSATGSTSPRIGNILYSAAFVNGYIDEVRITKGVCRYTSSFPVPTEAFPNTATAPVISCIASAESMLGAANVFASTATLAFTSADTPLGSVSALSVVVSACRIATGGPLGVPATLASIAITARVLAASPLGIAQPLAWHDFTRQIGDTVTRYVMDLITPSGTVRVPISSWQATLRTGASSYVQCVIPAAQPWGQAINSATSFRIYRRAVTASGQVIEYLMAEAPADTPQFDRGPTNHTCTLSGYAPGFAGQDVSTGTDRTLTGIRSISSGASYRVRCAVDWLLRPGQRGVVDGVPFVVAWINYYVNTTDAYMEAGT